MTQAWISQARKFATYFLTLYRPWTVPTSDGGTLPGNTTWHAFCIYMHDIENATEDEPVTLLNRVRSKWITNAAHGLRIAGEDRTAANKWRCEKASCWDSKEGNESLRSTREQPEGGPILSDSERIIEQVAAAEAQENMNILRDKTVADELLLRADHTHLEYYQATQFNLEKIYEPDEHQRTTNPIENEQAKNTFRDHKDSTHMKAILTQLKGDVIHEPSEDGDDDTIIPGPWKTLKPVPPGQRLSDQLNHTQRKIWNKVTNYFQQLVESRAGRRPKPKPLRLLVHGGPGTGKSFLAECIHQAATDLNLEIGCIAPTGIAASSLPNGRTIHNFGGIPPYRKKGKYLEKLNPTKLLSIQERAQHLKLALLIIDEISFVGPEMFAQVDRRLRQIMQNNEPFGGLAVIITGDFFQLPPIAPAETLYAALLKLHFAKATLDTQATSTSPAVEGTKYFATFQKIELTQQMRAASDPDHMKFLDTLRSTDPDRQAKTLELIQKIKVISKRDIEQDPAWMNAPIVVTSNEERFRINDLQTIALAKRTNCPRIIWFKPIMGIVKSGIDQNQVNYVYATSRQFKGVFVAGAPGFLMTNINPKRGLTNGTPVTLHSLVLHPLEDRQRVLTAITNGYGEDVQLQYNPHCILVEITNADPNDFKELTAVPGKAVIPLFQDHESRPFLVDVPNKKERVLLHAQTHPVDIGYSLTLHKIQGQTCKKLIVDLNHRPFRPQINFPGFYVAVSRVRRSEDLRIMPIQPGVPNLKFLTKLQPPALLITWLNAYNSDGFWDTTRIPQHLFPQTGQQKTKRTSKKQKQTTSTTGQPPEKQTEPGMTI